MMSTRLLRIITHNGIKIESRKIWIYISINAILDVFELVWRSGNGVLTENFRASPPLLARRQKSHFELKRSANNACFNRFILFYPSPLDLVLGSS
jgi:hypothetical protein